MPYGKRDCCHKAPTSFFCQIDVNFILSSLLGKLPSGHAPGLNLNAQVAARWPVSKFQALAFGAACAYGGITMRKFVTGAALAVALSAGFLAVTSSANAGLMRHYTLCWTGTTGGTDCVHLPRHYRLPGIKKPAVPNGTVSFTLTKMIISCLKGQVDTDGMYPYQEATIHSPKY